MKAYLSLFRIRFAGVLQYRAAALAGMATQYFWGGLSILLYAAFYRSGGGPADMTLQQLASYIWLQQAFLALFMMWFVENDIFEAITGGGVAYELCRPVDLYAQWFCRGMANRLARALLRFGPILLVAALLPAPYGLMLPPDIAAFGQFVLSMGLAYLLVVAFSQLMYIGTFYTLSPLGVRIVAASAVELLSGAIVPLPLLPPALRAALDWLPFASMQNLPLLVYSGSVSGADALWRIALQAFWLLVLVAAGRLWMRAALRRVVVQGG